MSEFFGQFHPLLVHLPIGIWVLAFLFKWLAYKNKNSIYASVLQTILLIIFASSILTSLTGYLLSLSGAYDLDLVSNHMWAGFVLSILSAALYWSIRGKKSVLLQNVFWVLAGLFLFITGHLGGSLTHGEDYLSSPARVYHIPEIENVQEALVYSDIVEPIFAQKCWSCHSAKKQKGELRLDGQEWIQKGGENGEVLLAHQSDKSELYKRLNLKKDDDDHMPPSGKTQLSEEEIKIVKWWINSGLSFDKKVKELDQSPEIQSILSRLEKGKEYDLIPENKISAADVESLKKIIVARISVSPIHQNSNYLSINLLGKSLPDSVWSEIQKVAPNISSLRANGCSLSDPQWKSFENFKNLRVLDLSRSNVTDKSFVGIANLSEIRILNLSQTHITEKGLSTLKHLENLRHLYLFGSKIDKSKWNQIKAEFPKTELDSGNYTVPIFESDTTMKKR